MTKRLATSLLAVGVLLFAGAALAQQTTVEIKTGEVLAVNGNQLIYRGAEGVKSVHVPDDFRFNMNGQELSVHQLKPGMRLTAQITTTQRPVEMITTEVRSGEIIHTQGGAVVVRREDGTLTKFTTKTIKESGAIVTKDGKPIDLMKLRKGDRISATIITRQAPTMVTEEEMKVYAQNAPTPRAQPKPKPAPVVVAQAKTEPRPEALPETGSPLPMIGIAGLALLLIATGLYSVRRFGVSQ